jgi:hypothetical protein
MFLVELNLILWSYFRVELFEGPAIPMINKNNFPKIIKKITENDEATIQFRYDV